MRKPGSREVLVERKPWAGKDHRKRFLTVLLVDKKGREFPLTPGMISEGQLGPAYPGLSLGQTENRCWEFQYGDSHIAAEPSACRGKSWQCC